MGFFVPATNVGVAHRARSLKSNLKHQDKVDFELDIPSLCHLIRLWGRAQCATPTFVCIGWGNILWILMDCEYSNALIDGHLPSYATV